MLVSDRKRFHIPIYSGFVIRCITRATIKSARAVAVITIHPRSKYNWKDRNYKQFTLSNHNFKEVYHKAAKYYDSINPDVSFDDVIKLIPSIGDVNTIINNYAWLNDVDKTKVN